MQFYTEGCIVVAKERCDGRVAQLSHNLKKSDGRFSADSPSDLTPRDANSHRTKLYVGSLQETSVFLFLSAKTGTLCNIGANDELHAEVTAKKKGSHKAFSIYSQTPIVACSIHPKISLVSSVKRRSEPRLQELIYSI